jgi:protease YdgD
MWPGWFHRCLLTGCSVLGVIFALASGSAIGVAAAEQRLPGIIGVDDRKAVDATGRGFVAVGHINVAGFSSRRQCTGTLVAPDRVVTAAHCLVHPRTGKPLPIGQIHFVAGVKGSSHRAHAKARCVHFASPEFRPREVRSDNLLGDMAQVILDRKLEVPPIPILTEARVGRDHSLVHPSYPKDSRYKLVAHSGCGVLGVTNGLWLTNCDTSFASSGGPVIAEVGGKPHLAAVMVGFIEQKFTIAVPVSTWPELVGRSNCEK